MGTLASLQFLALSSFEDQAQNVLGLGQTGLSSFTNFEATFKFK